MWLFASETRLLLQRYFFLEKRLDEYNTEYGSRQLRETKVSPTLRV